MTAAPVISVLLPVYNGEPFITEAVKSILGQTFADFELVIIDDASTDSTPSTLSVLAGEDERIVLLRNERNLGICETLNRGISVARGEFIARMDADDVSLPQRLEKQLRFMREHPDVGICGTWVRYIDADGNALSVSRVPTGDRELKSALLFSVGIFHSSAVFRRSSFPSGQLRYDDEYRHAEDYELWSRAAGFTKLSNLAEVLVAYRIHQRQSRSSVPGPQHDAALRVQLRQLAALGVDPDPGQISTHDTWNSRRFPLRRQFLDGAESWLLLLQQANQISGVYPEPEFTRVLSSRWYIACRYCTGLGPWVWRRHRASALAGRQTLHGEGRFLAASLGHWVRAIHGPTRARRP